MNTKKMKLNKKDRIEVNWIDSFRQNGPWIGIEEFDYNQGDHDSKQIYSIGYFINSTKDNIYLAQQCDSYKEGNVSNIVSIPHGCVLKIRKLK
jgi:hypothetical protein